MVPSGFVRTLLFWGVVARILCILTDTIDNLHKMLKKNFKKNYNLKIVSKNIYKCL